MNIDSEDELKSLIQQILFVIRKFDWLINSYVLDYYVEDHWERKLPNSWRDSLKIVDPKALNFLLSESATSSCSFVCPLSLLSLKAVVQKLSISRKFRPDKQRRESDNSHPVLNHPKLKNIFSKFVKPKKRHEIHAMSEICYQTAKRCGVRYVVDLGSGLGHLARKICYGYDLNVCCIEMKPEFNEQARLIDGYLETAAGKHLDEEFLKRFNHHPPVHITLKLTKDISPNNFLLQIRDAFNIKNDDTDFSFGIIGLHTCGDLAACLIKLFCFCEEAKFLNIVGCCYMKLTTTETVTHCGYPLSDYVQKLNPAFRKLSYESREIACHAIEIYNKRLYEDDYNDLKVHSYRACLEEIIVRNWPQQKHLGLRSVKHSNSMSFADYCKKATANMNIGISEKDINGERIKKNLSEWKNIVIFYTLRLMLAPLVESVILYDRILYLRENGCEAVVEAIFNPLISPRNIITTAIKR